jgi:ABC-2 type transport system ATP-binding protein
MRNNTIIVEQLKKVYGETRAVDDISFSVESGEVYSLLGHNGAGKTTTVEILEGLRNPTSGKATILGADSVKEYDRIRKRVGILPQSFEPFDNLKPLEAVEYWGNLFELRPTREEMNDLLDRVGLSHRKSVFAKKMSGGEKRKLGIALALINDPEMLFLDEPTTGLDPKARRDLWDLIESMKHNGTTILLTTHYLDEAEVLSDHVGIMNKGKIIAEGTPREIVAKHGHRTAITLVGAGKEGIEELRRQGIEASLNNEDVLIPVADTAELKTWFTKLSTLDVKIKDVYTKRDTLEDVFLRLVSTKVQGGWVQ